MNKTALFILAALMIASRSMAQQEQQHTQFMYAKQAYNPAAVGSYGMPSLTVLYRNQWAGLEGAPKTMGASFQTSAMNDNVGLGANLMRRTIGIQDRYTLDAQYAYRIRAMRGILGVGLQASVRYFRNNFLDSRLKGTQDISTDPGVPQDAVSKTVPNFGAGIFYHNERFYLGFSAPRLVSNNIDFSQAGAIISREAQHFYCMAGYEFDLNAALSLQPQVLLKYVKNAPFDADINATLTAQKKFVGAVTYRLGGGAVSKGGESIDVLLGMQAMEKLFFGLSYDIGLTKLRRYNNGSVEAIARYFIRVKSEGEQVNPRFF